MSELHSKNTSTKLIAPDEPNGSHFNFPENIFELISPLTEELALSIIDEMTKVPGNQPIGKQPPLEQTTEMDTPNPTVNANANQPSNQNSNLVLAAIIILIISLSIITWVVIKKKQVNSKTQNK